MIISKSLIFRKGTSKVQFLRSLNTSYNEDPRPEYEPKKKSVNNPRAASPPTVATIQRGTLPISLILIIVIKNKVLSRTNGLTKYSN